jgi:membrane protein DedA with SNARE-associated domain
VITFALVAAAVGALVGGWVGYKVGRTTEKFSPTKKEKEEDAAPKKKLPRAFGR